MAKKKNQRKTKGGGWIWILGFVVLAGSLVWLATRASSSGESGGSSGLASLFRPTTLSPERFSGKTRQAYQVARDAPELLEQLPCYCGCMSNAGHRSNLDCFTDNHGVT